MIFTSALFVIIRHRFVQFEIALYVTKTKCERNITPVEILEISSV